MYLAALRELSKFCEYGETLNEMLLDRLVFGVNHEGLQQRFLAEKELTYEKAVELALAAETAEKGSKDLKNSSTSGVQQHSFHLAQHAGRQREGNHGTRWSQSTSRPDRMLQKREGPPGIRVQTQGNHNYIGSAVEEEIEACKFKG